MPLVQGLTQQLGADKINSVLLSVDEDPGTPKETVLKELEAMREDVKTDAAIALIPGGLTGSWTLLHTISYSFFVVDGNGIVLGKDLTWHDAEKLIKEKVK